MNLPPSHRAARSLTDDLAVRWANRIIVLSVVLIALATLYPFRLRIPEGLLIRQVLRDFVTNPTNKVDLIANIVLFLPLGFGVSAKLLNHKRLWRPPWLVVLGCSAGLSLTVEMLQILLNDRTYALTDVLTNTLGGYLGYLTFKYGRSRVLGIVHAGLQGFQRLVSRLSWRQVSAAFLAYMVLAIAVVGWLNGSTLRTWDLNARLLIGNDPADQLPWSGRVAHVQICDRALSASNLTAFFTQAQAPLPCGDHLVAAYPLTSPSGLIDTTGQSPNLVWQGSAPTSALTSPEGAWVSAEHWLEMLSPATQLNQRLQASSELTLAAVITAAQPDLSSHFHRILSLSAQWSLGNLTLMQWRSNLLLWVATSFNKSGVLAPQGFLSNTWADGQPHRIVMTYSGLVVRGYVDSAEQPLMVLLTPIDYQVISYVLVFVPIGVLLRLLVSAGKGQLFGQLFGRLALTSVGCVLPPLVLESILAHQSDRPIRLANLLLSILIISVTFWVARGLSTRAKPTLPETTTGD
ncbi:MAG TPA: VanZ family protein [Microcoleaceae cyanobacterium]